jgi:hypothetical protein
MNLYATSIAEKRCFGKCYVPEGLLAHRINNHTVCIGQILLERKSYQLQY